MIYDVPNYYNSMDQGYKPVATDDKPLAEMNIKDIGISTLPSGDQIQGLRGRIFQGASRVELGFSGAGKGNMQGHQTTPEMYGTDERQDIRELAKLNEITLSTHTSYAIGPLSGMTQQGFDDAAREKTVKEIQRAIDFAGDTARGGAVVIHTGEFPRAISEHFPGFRQFEEEPEKATIHLVDKQTGHIIQSVRKDQKVMWPKWLEDPKTHEYVAGDDGFPKPEFDAKTGEFKVVEADWKDFTKYADWHNKNKKDPQEKDITPAEAYYRATLDARRRNSLAWALQYQDGYKRQVEMKEKYEKALKLYEQIESTADPEQKWRLKLQQPQDQHNLVPPETQYPTEYIKERLDQINQQLRYSQEMVLSQMQQAKEMEQVAARTVPIEAYGVERAAKSIAQAAEFAYQKTKQLESRGELKSPIFVAPENIFPETYGAHPTELRNLVMQARKEFVSRNRQSLGEDKAEKLAAEHIKATFDIGHGYTWRKYFDNDPKKSIEENNKSFNEWLLKQVDMLNKDKIIGEVHISDNFGWEDEHVTPGRGMAPIKEFIDRMKKAGVKNVIVEPAHQDYKAMLGGWREFGSPIYGSPKPDQRWTDLEFSYFGKGRSPYFIFGDYSPSQEFSLWSQVPLE